MTTQLGSFRTIAACAAVRFRHQGIASQLSPIYEFARIFTSAVRLLPQYAHRAIGDLIDNELRYTGTLASIISIIDYICMASNVCSKKTAHCRLVRSCRQGSALRLRPTRCGRFCASRERGRWNSGGDARAPTKGQVYCAAMVEL